jgi:hypothetical protein
MDMLKWSTQASECKFRVKKCSDLVTEMTQKFVDLNIKLEVICL